MQVSSALWSPAPGPEVGGLIRIPEFFSSLSVQRIFLLLAGEIIINLHKGKQHRWRVAWQASLTSRYQRRQTIPSFKMIILIILCSNWKQLYQVLQTLTPDQSQLLLNQSCGACYVVMGKLFFTPDGLSDLRIGWKVSWRQSWWGFSSGKICSTCYTGFIVSWALTEGGLDFFTMHAVIMTLATCQAFLTSFER